MCVVRFFHQQTRIRATEPTTEPLSLFHTVQIDVEKWRPKSVRLRRQSITDLRSAESIHDEITKTNAREERIKLATTGGQVPLSQRDFYHGLPHPMFDPRFRDIASRGRASIPSSQRGGMLDAYTRSIEVHGVGIDPVENQLLLELLNERRKSSVRPISAPSSRKSTPSTFSGARKKSVTARKQSATKQGRSVSNASSRASRKPSNLTSGEEKEGGKGVVAAEEEGVDGDDEVIMHEEDAEALGEFVESMLFQADDDDDALGPQDPEKFNGEEDQEQQHQQHQPAADDKQAVDEQDSIVFADHSDGGGNERPSLPHASYSAPHVSFSSTHNIRLIPGGKSEQQVRRKRKSGSGHRIKMRATPRKVVVSDIDDDAAAGRGSDRGRDRDVSNKVMGVRSFLVELKDNISAGLLVPAKGLDVTEIEAEVTSLFERNPEYNDGLDTAAAGRSSQSDMRWVQSGQGTTQRLVERRKRMGRIFNMLQEDGLLVIRKPGDLLRAADPDDDDDGEEEEKEKEEEKGPRCAASDEEDVTDDENELCDLHIDNSKARKMARRREKEVVDRRENEVRARNVDKLLRELAASQPESQNDLGERRVGHHNAGRRGRLTRSLADTRLLPRRDMLRGSSFLNVDARISRTGLKSDRLAETRRLKLLGEFVKSQNDNSDLQVRPRRLGVFVPLSFFCFAFFAAFFIYYGRYLNQVLVTVKYQIKIL